MARALKRVSRSDLTITRHRHGRGFCYRDKNGNLICERQVKARLVALAIPPAWTEVAIAVHPRAHVQAIGIDDAGRTQYIYHPDWELKRSEHKMRRLTALTKALPRIRRRVREDLAAEAGSEMLAVAIAVAMIDQTAMRVGRERYLKASGTRGAGTLYARDITVSGDELTVTFRAKGGKRSQYRFRDPRLADAVTRIKQLSRKRLLVHRNAEGRVRPINTAAINLYLREVAGTEIAAKDFRTLHASAMAGEALSRLDGDLSATARKRALAGVAREVSEFLHNTPMISRKSYIAPCLFRLFEEGRFAGLWEQAKGGPTGLRRREQRLAAVLAAD